jgi:hypothetical protein
MLSTHNSSIDPLLHIMNLEGYFDITISLNVLSLGLKHSVKTALLE